jgi:hypothetical protein
LLTRPPRSAIAKVLQLYFWPAPPHPHLASLLTDLATYHAAFAVFYLLSLRVVACCRRQTEEFRVKCRNKDMGEEDVRALQGWAFKGTNWLARRRDFRQCLFDARWWLWLGDLYAWAVCP